MGKTIDTDELKKKFEPRQAYFTEGIFRKIDETPPVEQGQRWTKVAERMPPEHDSIFAKFKGTDRWRDAMWEKQSDVLLVTVEYEDGTKSVETAYTQDGKWKYKSAVVMRIPIAWRPFPDPYEEEQ